MLFRAPHDTRQSLQKGTHLIYSVLFHINSFFHLTVVHVMLTEAKEQYKLSTSLRDV